MKSSDSKPQAHPASKVQKPGDNRPRPAIEKLGMLYWLDLETMLLSEEHNTAEDTSA